MCVDREQIIEVVFNGYATPVESLVGHVAGEMENPDLPLNTTATPRTRCSTTSATPAARTAPGRA